jgi:PEP-CTERM motif.
MNRFLLNLVNPVKNHRQYLVPGRISQTIILVLRHNYSFLLIPSYGSLSMKFKRIATILGSIVLGLAAISTAKADPLFFSNVTVVQNGGGQVGMFANQGQTLLGPQLTFSIDVTGTLPINGVDTLQVTFTQAGSQPIVQSFQIPVFGSVDPPFTLQVTFVVPISSFQPLAASLTIDLLNSSPDFVIPSGPNAGQTTDSFTYHFNVAQPVPEPASLAIAGIGIAGLFTGIGRSARAARKNKQRSPFGKARYNRSLGSKRPAAERVIQ